ncbi:MAG: ATP-binding cassette domain-containing protein [Anaerotardibacter sp.]
MNQVQVKGLQKSYPSFSLKDVSFGLEEGKITGFIGRNGAGKTTVIKSMLNLIHADAGEITYFGQPLSDNEATIKQSVGYSIGTISWYPRRTLRQIINTTKQFYSNWDNNALEYYRGMFALDLDKKPIELSEGMKVKCNLLLALSHQAKVLILDEPTSGLAPFSRDELLEVFTRLRDEGVGTIPPGPPGKDIWGTVTMNDRGQIVIPKATRDKFDLKAGDRLIVGSDEVGIALFPVEYFQKQVEHVMKFASQKDASEAGKA